MKHTHFAQHYGGAARIHSARSAGLALLALGLLISPLSGRSSVTRNFVSSFEQKHRSPAAKSPNKMKASPKNAAAASGPCSRSE